MKHLFLLFALIFSLGFVANAQPKHRHHRAMHHRKAHHSMHHHHAMHHRPHHAKH